MPLNLKSTALALGDSARAAHMGKLRRPRELTKHLCHSRKGRWWDGAPGAEPTRAGGKARSTQFTSAGCSDAKDGCKIPLGIANPKSNPGVIPAAVPLCEEEHSDTRRLEHRA